MFIKKPNRKEYFFYIYKHETCIQLRITHVILLKSSNKYFYQLLGRTFSYVL